MRKSLGSGRIILMTVILFMICAGGQAVFAETLADYEIPVTCRISENIPVDLDMDFTYSLQADSDDCPMPEGTKDGVKTVHMTDSGDVKFGEIRFDRPDVFHYTLKETTKEKGFFRRDKTEYHAALMADTDGKVKMVVNNDNGKKAEKIEFANSYNRKKAPAAEAVDSPKTGDGETPELFAALICICLALIIMIKRRTGTDSKCFVRFAAATAAVLSMWTASALGQGAYAAVTTTNNYSQLPVNNVQINYLNFNTAEFTSLNSVIKKGSFQYLIDGAAQSCTSIYWTSSTAPKFGTSNATSTANANLGSNTVSGNLFKLRFKNSATLPDGTKADVLMVFSDLYFGLSKNTNGTTGSNYYVPIIRITSAGAGRYCNSGVGINTNNSGRLMSVRSATRIKTTVKIVQPGTETAVQDMQYILGFRDLDVKDNTTATGSSVDRYAGHYSEGIGLISGYSQPVYLSSGSYIRQDTWDSVPKLRGTRSSDGGGIESGFDISVKTGGFSYYWYGSHNMPGTTADRGGAMGTAFGYSPTVTVYASAGSGGSIEKPGATTYLVNSSTSYTYTPSEGYTVKSLKVDGVSVLFNMHGGTYTFDKLTETSETGYDHTIDVQFRKNQGLTVTKNVRGTLGDRRKVFNFLIVMTGLEANKEFAMYTTNSENIQSQPGYGEVLSNESFRSSSSGAATLRFCLKDDQLIEFYDLTAGSHYIISEGASDHIASFSISGNGSSPVVVTANKANTARATLETSVETVDEGDGNVTVAFMNKKDLAVPTGLRVREGPLIPALILLAILLAAVAAAIVGRRMRRQ